MTQENGTLRADEYHPMAANALVWIKNYLLSDVKKTFMLLEALASCAIEGNRLAEVCHETLRRLVHGEPISDRYLLGLAWYLKHENEEEK